METLQLLDTAAAPEISPCPVSASVTWPCMFPSTTTEMLKRSQHSGSEGRPATRLDHTSLSALPSSAAVGPPQPVRVAVAMRVFLLLLRGPRPSTQPRHDVVVMGTPLQFAAKSWTVAGEVATKILTGWLASSEQERWVTIMLIWLVFCQLV